MNMNRLNLSRLLILAGLLIFTVTCGSSSSVEGHTYQDNGGVVKIEFQSGGKAYVSAGPMTQTCAYSQSDKTVTLTCEDDKTEFIVEKDGALTGPPNGMMSRLTRVD